MKAKKPKTPTTPCDPSEVAAFDYSQLSVEFHSLSKPAQRALLNHGIKNARELAKYTQAEILGLHGMGKASLPKLKLILSKAKLKFRE